MQRVRRFLVPVMGVLVVGLSLAGQELGPDLPMRRDPDAPRAVAGYVGPYFNVEARTDRVAVLPGSVRTEPGPTWTSRGLVRNETTGVVRHVKIVAKLYDRFHKEIGRSDTWVPLRTLRAGEPAPFVVTASLPSDAVASAEWEVTFERERRAVAADGELQPLDVRRPFELDVHWSRPYGGSDRLAGYPHEDSGSGPLPFVMFGTLRHVGQIDTADARVLAAWLDHEDRVLHVDWLVLRPVEDDLRPHASSRLGAGKQVDFSYSNADPAIAPALANARLVLWGVSDE